MRRLVWATLVLGLITARVRAADENHLGQDVPMQTEAGAGHPQTVSCLAASSRTPAYYGYYVGGGRVCGGNGLGCQEGTWGWDYGAHRLYHPFLMLGFGSTRSQGGTGSYSTTKGPEVPNPLGFKFPSRETHCEGEEH
jgi:hypothetical protein